MKFLTSNQFMRGYKFHEHNSNDFKVSLRNNISVSMHFSLKQFQRSCFNYVNNLIETFGSLMQLRYSHHQDLNHGLLYFHFFMPQLKTSFILQTLLESLLLFQKLIFGFCSLSGEAKLRCTGPLAQLISKSKIKISQLKKRLFSFFKIALNSLFHFIFLFFNKINKQFSRSSRYKII